MTGPAAPKAPHVIEVSFSTAWNDTKEHSRKLWEKGTQGGWVGWKASHFFFAKRIEYAKNMYISQLLRPLWLANLLLNLKLYLSCVLLTSCSLILFDSPRAIRTEADKNATVNVVPSNSNSFSKKYFIPLLCHFTKWGQKNVRCLFVCYLFWQLFSWCGPAIPIHPHTHKGQLQHTGPTVYESFIVLIREDLKV